MSHPDATKETYYSIEYYDLGIDYCGPGPWRSYELSTHGSSRDELLENACVEVIDQDGGTLNTIGLGYSNEVDTAIYAAVNDLMQSGRDRL